MPPTRPTAGAGVRTVTIDPVTRVEGHGTVTVTVDEAGHVIDTRLHVVEFRGFERFIQGRLYWEAPAIVQHLCGICPVSHHLCAAKAMDQVIGVDTLTPAAEALRRLMHYGQTLQSNALHFFHLASPDLLFGFGAPAARRDITAVAAAYPDVARSAIALRRFGQEVIKATGGRKVHPTSAVAGGISQGLSEDDRLALRAQVGQVLQWATDGLALCKRLLLADAPRAAAFATAPSNFVSLVGTDGALDLYDGRLRAIDAGGVRLLDGVPASAYAEVIAEEVRPWSYMKFPYLRALGRERGWYRVGPLAHMNCCDAIPSPEAERERRAFLGGAHGRPVQSTLHYHWARLIDLLHAAEMIGQLLEQPARLAGERMAAPGPRRPRGVAWLEAPRGTLIHDYEVDAHDQITRATLIVATTHNNEGINRSLRAVAADELDGLALTDGLLNHLEVAVRAYDPCLSCATHAVGQMPLVVRVERPDGTEIARRRRQGAA
jgi:NAD-reducing hydrogenase large subunit